MSPNVLGEILVLSLGKSQTIPAQAKSSIRVGSKSILQVADLGNRLVVIGKKVGETHLTVGTKAYRVEVVPVGADEFYRDLQKLLKTKRGLEADLRGGKVQVVGHLYRFKDWEDLASLATHSQASYEFAAKPLSDVADVALKTFQELARHAGLPTPKLLLGSSLMVSLPAGTDDYLKLAEKTFSPYGIGVRVIESQVKLEPLVRTHVILAEISKSASRTFGFKWPESYEAKVLPNLQPIDLMVELKALEQKGLGKILANPNLLCRSGASADFLAGGEIPIKTGGKLFGGSVQWKQHGMILKVSPVADASGAMSIEIETEVSLIDKANEVEGIPGMKTNRVHSHFDLSGRKTIALSGLIREDWGLTREGIAGLASIPILGALFRSQTFQNNKSELVIFVTPEVVLPEGDGDPITMPEGWASDDL
jgi:pilus assembly protein CpaC